MPDPTPTPEAVEQAIRIAGTFFDPTHEAMTLLPECLTSAMTSAGLVRVTETFEVESDWAEAWNALNDGERWRFRIRANTDGWGENLPVTAHDFAAHWLSLLDPGADPRHASLLFDIENALAYNQGDVPPDDVGIDVIDERSLEITLERPRETFPSVVASLAFHPPGPAGIDDPDFCRGNGRFREMSREEDVLTLAPSEGYWDEEAPGLDRIDLTAFPPGLALTEFTQSQLDLVRLSGTDVVRLREDGAVSDFVMNAQPRRVIVLVPNVLVPPFNSVEVRRALGYVIDRRRLEAIVEGRVVPATRLFPPGMFPAFDDAAAGITVGFDVDAALEELEDSPHPDPAEWPGFGLDIPSSEGYLDRVARDVANQLRENLGIQVPIRVHDPEEYAIGLRERRYSFAWLDWTYPYADPAACYLELFASWRDPVRPVSWTDPEYEELLQAADAIPTSDERATAWAGCEGLLQERGACIPLVHPVERYLVQPWLEGLPQDGRGRFITGEVFGIDFTRNLTVTERPED